MIGWVMPSILALALLMAGVLHFLAARTRHEPSTPARSAPSERERRVFVGPEITPTFLNSLLGGHTQMQADNIVAVYIGKWITLSGSVSQVTASDSSSVFTRSSLVTFDQARGEPMVFMHFDEQWKEQLSILRPGSRITVVGRITKIYRLGINLEQCELA